ncbi:CPBP family intramembrane glutamic endopeptidase [Paraclostridium sordellii]|uniref:CPBP family intramembrane glutamic endopeptidase n=1 Tax=Paraclostridium sordellii TaxID=1505 RepID=UPI0018C302A3|nr:CPBP family intramembrane glutamic endopeptidase [Paeniclostridium sordellii]
MFFLSNFEKIKIYFEGLIGNIIIFQLFNCAIEEILFRVILIEEIQKKCIKEKYQIIISSIIFGLYHIILVNDTTNIYMLMSFFIGTFIAGIGFAYIYIVSENYIYVVIIHTVYNVIQNCIQLQFNTLNMSNKLVVTLHIYLGIIFIISGIICKNPYHIFRKQNKKK